MEHIPMELLREVPPITRYWLLGIIGTAVVVHCGIVKEIDLIYSYDKVFARHEYWRLLTSFLYFREFGLNLVLSLYFTMRTSSSLEKSFDSRRLDYVWLLFVNAVFIVAVASFIRQPYVLGAKLNDALLYIWARRNSGLRVEMFGLLEFGVAYLPFTYAVINCLLYGHLLNEALMNIVPGHVAFLLLDVFPKIHGRNPLSPPGSRN